MWKWQNILHSTFIYFHIFTFSHFLVMNNTLKYFLLVSLYPLLVSKISAQENYHDSLIDFQQSYVKNHGVVKGNDKKLLQFYPVMATYRVQARVERIYEAPWFKMETSGKEKQVYRVYAILHFKLPDT